VEEREAAVDDDLGLRARHERALVGLERETAEVPVAEHVRERLALTTATNQLASRRALVVGERAVVLGVELDARKAERAGEDVLRVDARRRDAPRREVVRRAFQNLGEGHPSSARRRSSAVSASVYSSKSPCSTWSSRCVVSLMR